MKMYNLTNLTNDNTLLTFFYFGNEATNGWLGLSLLILAYILPFLSLLIPFGEKRAAGLMAFFGGIAGIALLWINLIPLKAAAGGWVISAAAIVWLFVDNT